MTVRTPSGKAAEIRLDRHGTDVHARALSIHQAGHVLLCVYYGIRILEISPPGSVTPDMEVAECSVSTPGEVEKYVRMLLAGGVAEGRYRKAGYAFTDEDLARIRAILSRQPDDFESWVTAHARRVAFHMADPRMWRTLNALANYLAALTAPVRDSDLRPVVELVRNHLRTPLK